MGAHGFACGSAGVFLLDDEVGVRVGDAATMLLSKKCGTANFGHAWAVPTFEAQIP